MWTGTILGVDPSLTCTGLAKLSITPDGINKQVARITTTPPKDELGVTIQTETVRQQRVSYIRRRIVAAAHDADLVVIEGLFYDRKTPQASLIDRSWLWGSIIDQLGARRIPWVVINPKKRAKFATDNGNDGKEKVAAGLDRLWRDASHGLDDNEIDALIMATMGAVHKCRRSLPLRLMEHHHTVVSGIDWPATKDEQ